MNTIRKIVHFYILALFSLSIIFFYPGIFSGDTHFQYHEFIDHVYNDFQPVIMNIWWYFFRVKGSVFLVHLCFYYLGIWLIIASLLNKNRFFICLGMLIFFSNPLIAFNVLNVWKDIGMLSSLILCVGILIYIPKHPSKWLFGILLLVAFYGINVRYNAIFAFIPIIYYIVFLYLNIFMPKITKKYILSFFISIALIIGMLFANWGITYKIFSAEFGYIQSINMRYDLSAIECMTDYKYQMPKVFFAEPDKVEQEKKILCKNFSFEQSDSIFWWTPVNHLQPFSSSITKDTFNLLRKEWVVTIIKYFPTYISFRGKVFWHSLKTNNWYLADYSGYFPEVMSKSVSVLNLFSKFFNHYLGLIFLILGCLNFINKIFSKRLFTLSGIILLSSLFYELAWFVMIPVADSRYFLWVYCGIFLSFILDSDKNQTNFLKK